MAENQFSLGIIAGYLLVGYTFAALDFLRVSRLDTTESRTLLALGMVVLIAHHAARARSEDARKKGE